MAAPILDTHHAIVGSSGAGKTVTAKGEVEQLLREKRHLAIIDPTDAWYGMRSNVAGDGPGFDLPIFGGRHADVPIGPHDGDAIARIVIEQQVSAIVSLAHIHEAALQRLFMAAFVKRLRAKPRGNFHLVADEADELCPQTARDDVGFQLTEDMIWIAKRGRLAGFVLTVITQRPADISKAVLSQMQTIVAHQLVDPRDQKAIDDYLKAKGDKAIRAEVMASLPSLGQGERWVYSPKLGLLERGVSPPLTTFDSSRTPAPGEVHVEPKMLGAIDVGAIAEALAKPEAEPEPTAKEIATGIPDRSLPILAAKTARILDLEDELARTKTALGQAEGLGQVLEDGLRRIRSTIDVLLEDTPNATPTAFDPWADPEVLNQRPAQAPALPAKERTASSAIGAERKPLAVLAGAAPAGLTEASWATLAGYKRTGGTWGTYKSRLRAAGFIEQRDALWFATAAGVEAAGAETVPMPAPGPELVARWAEAIPGVSRMLQTLQRRYPHFTTKEGLAADLGMAAGGGTFGTYLSRLRANGLLDENGKKLRLTPALMGDAGS